MPNHVHFVMVPTHEDGLRAAIADAHRRFTRSVNFREGWRGHLWQERFHSFVMDESHLHAAIPYVEDNPVRAGLCASVREWPWSSAAALRPLDIEWLCLRERALRSNFSRALSVALPVFGLVCAAAACVSAPGLAEPMEPERYWQAP